MKRPEGEGGMSPGHFQEAFPCNVLLLYVCKRILLKTDSSFKAPLKLDFIGMLFCGNNP